jgi:hypothetical protein
MGWFGDWLSKIRWFIIWGIFFNYLCSLYLSLRTKFLKVVMYSWFRYPYQGVSVRNHSSSDGLFYRFKNWILRSALFIFAFYTNGYISFIASPYKYYFLFYWYSKLAALILTWYYMKLYQFEQVLSTNLYLSWESAASDSFILYIYTLTIV